ncbi:MAG: FHA domain-containing protein [Lachnospiraceae bacterium]|nr:FHA domain-containing protein [Lachnospiraceae bacterium]
MFYLLVVNAKKAKSYALEGKNSFLLGRRTRNSNPDICLNSPYVSRSHGKLVRTKEGWCYQEMGSKNGTWLNKRKIAREANGEFSPIPLRPGNILCIQNTGGGSSEDNVWMLFTDRELADIWQSFPLSGGTIRIGRNSSNDIVLSSPYVSKQHATISRNNKGGFSIQDNGSRAGIIVNGRNISGSRPLNDFDIIYITDRTLIFTRDTLYFEGNSRKAKPARSEPNDKGNPNELRPIKNSSVSPGPLILEAHLETKKVPNQNGRGMVELIRDVRISVLEGSLVALLGQSGAGKSTVMNCLNGMDTAGMQGTVLFCGEDLRANFNRLKHQIGSVPQKEVFHEMLTVEEELREAAIFRLPHNTPRKEIEWRVDRTISQLGLQHVRKNQIKKCSGGEMRRINIAIDLVADRKLLCLDEPDAGLDPSMKRELFEILRNLAHQDRKSILVIIHDVSELSLFDQVIMMVKYQNVGRLAFSGSPEEAEKYFGTSVRQAYDLLAENPERYIQ